MYLNWSVHVYVEVGYGIPHKQTRVSHHECGMSKAVAKQVERVHTLNSYAVEYRVKRR